MSVKDATVMVIDMLMAGIDTVIKTRILLHSLQKNTFFHFRRRHTQLHSFSTSWQEIQKNKKNYEMRYSPLSDPKVNWSLPELSTNFIT